MVAHPFHLAFPVTSLANARAFYGEMLGCPEGRSSEEWVDFNLSYRFNERLTATFDIANLFDSKFQDYFGPDPAL